MSSSDSEDKPFNNFYTSENTQFYAAKVYEAPDPDTLDFRVLEILQGNDGDIIKCNIIQPFKLAQPYEALSYRAGDPTEIGGIIVNDHPFNAFATLSAAIRRLRYKDKSRIVWIDQICINQNDITERNSQVQRMRMIYEKAEQVIGWLGPLAGGEIAFNAVQSFYEIYRRQEAQYKQTLLEHRALQFWERKAILQRISDEHLKKLELANQANQADDNEDFKTIKALVQFWNTEFWNRAWIWQEIIVARSVTLFWDTKSMDSDPFFTTADIMLQIGLRFSSRQIPLLQKILIRRSPMHLIAVVGSLRRSWKPNSPLNIKYLLRKIRHAEASDMRDRIYAISGLVPEGYRITPSYTQTTDSVYCLTAWLIISQDKSLDILALCAHPNVPSALLLPSWCPNWSTRATHTREPLILDATEIRHRQVWEIGFQASKKLAASCDMKVRNDNGTGTQSFSLMVEGLQIDRVEEITARPKKHQSPDTMYESLLQSCTQLVSRKRALTEELKKEVDRTITVDITGRKDPDDELSSYKYTKQSLKVDAITGSRLFFTSRTGLMGMAPPHVKPGDLICVLFGAAIPFLLRRNGSFYILIGEVYISDGYMEGRAIDELETGTRSPEWLEIH